MASIHADTNQCKQLTSYSKHITQLSDTQAKYGRGAPQGHTQLPSD